MESAPFVAGRACMQLAEIHCLPLCQSSIIAKNPSITSRLPRLGLRGAALVHPQCTRLPVLSVFLQLVVSEKKIRLTAVY